MMTLNLKSSWVTVRCVKLSFSKTWPSMKANGYAALKFVKAREFKSGQTVLYTRATGPTLKPMARVD